MFDMPRPPVKVTVSDSTAPLTIGGSGGAGGITMGIGTVGTAGIYTVAPSTINSSDIYHSGISYTKQTFEDRPTLFGARLRVVNRITAMEMAQTREPAHLQAEVERQQDKLISKSIQDKCPSCVGCDHVEVRRKSERGYLTDDIAWTMEASCGRDTDPGAIGKQCPDGTWAVRKEMTMLIPKMTTLPGPVPVVEIPTEVFKEEASEPEPYIRKEDKDVPKSSSPDAW